METPPSIMKIQAYKYNSTPDNQLSIFFNNNTTISTTTSVMETQLHNTRSSTPAFTQNLGSNDNNIIPIDISFSSFLKPPHLDDSEISIFDAQKYFNELNQDPKTRWSSFPPPQVIINNDTNLDDHTTISRQSSVDGYNRARSFHATPTASSEASWNSQSGLLSNPPGALAVSLRNLHSKSSKSDTQRDRKRGGISNRTTGGTKWFFQGKCPCSGKKSVQVEELVVISESKTMSPANYTKKQIPDHPHTHQNQTHKGRIQETITDIPDRQQRLISSSTIQENEHFPTKVLRQQRFSTSGRPLNDVPVGGFSFPILRNPSLPQQSSLDDPPRESLEVFQPPRKSGGRGFGFPGSPISRLTATDDDMASDASSDLFEIESFSTQTTTCPTYRRRDPPDEAQNFLTARRLAASNIYCNRRSMDEPTTPSIAQTECYEPSEASIDWSVTTAEGFERTSVISFSTSASEVGDVANGRLAWVVNSISGGDVGRKKGNGGGLLMSCRQEKAVSVGPQPVKCAAAAGGDAGQHGGGFMGPSASTEAGKLPLMSTFMHVSSSRAGAGSSSIPNASIIKPPPIAPSHSARLSLAFAT